MSSVCLPTSSLDISSSQGILDFFSPPVGVLDDEGVEDDWRHRAPSPSYSDGSDDLESIPAVALAPLVKTEAEPPTTIETQLQLYASEARDSSAGGTPASYPEASVDKIPERTTSLAPIAEEESFVSHLRDGGTEDAEEPDESHAMWKWEQDQVQDASTAFSELEETETSSKSSPTRDVSGKEQLSDGLTEPPRDTPATSKTIGSSTQGDSGKNDSHGPPNKEPILKITEISTQGDPRKNDSHGRTSKEPTPDKQRSSLRPDAASFTPDDDEIDGLLYLRNVQQFRAALADGPTNQRRLIDHRAWDAKRKLRFVEKTFRSINALQEHCAALTNETLEQMRTHQQWQENVESISGTCNAHLTAYQNIDTLYDCFAVTQDGTLPERSLLLERMADNVEETIRLLRSRLPLEQARVTGGLSQGWDANTSNQGRSQSNSVTSLDSNTACGSRSPARLTVIQGSPSPTTTTGAGTPLTQYTSNTSLRETADTMRQRSQTLPMPQVSGSTSPRRRRFRGRKQSSPRASQDVSGTRWPRSSAKEEAHSAPSAFG